MLIYRVSVYDKGSGDLICWFSTGKKRDAEAYKQRAEALGQIVKITVGETAL